MLVSDFNYLWISFLKRLNVRVGFEYFLLDFLGKSKVFYDWRE